MKKLFIFLSVAVVLAGMGCKKGYFDINTNPNQATNASPDLVLTNALNVTATQQINSFNFINEWLAYWAPSGSYAINASDLSTYKQTTNFGDGLWLSYYHNLEDYHYTEQSAHAKTLSFYEAAARIMKAYVFGQLVDMFNNVPYSQAFQGTGIIQPKYDDAQAIYTDLVSQLDTAITLMKRVDAIGSSTSDILFGGKNTLWIQFANTLELRLLLRQSQVSGQQSYIQAQIAKIVAEGSGFLSVDAGVNPGYVNSSGQQNPFWAGRINPAGTYIDDFWRANQFPIDFCKANNDNRYKYWYAPTAADATLYQGNVIGSPTNHAANTASTFGPGVLKSVSQPSIILSAAESYFLQAEAMARGWISGSAKTAYQKGVTASFVYLEGAVAGQSAAAAYLGQTGNTDVDFNTAVSLSSQLAIIIKQKWAAMNTVTPFEAWADYRRLGLPANIPLSASPYVDVLAIPYRILYPTSEYSTNSTNVNAQGTINHHTSKIFWQP